MVLTMDNRESINKSVGRPSNSKVILAKQFFETLTHTNK